MTTSSSDPRPAYALTVEWVTALVGNVAPEQWTASTPCPDWDVRALVGHLLTTVRRPVLVARGADPREIPLVVTDVPDQRWARELTAAGRELASAWAADGLLDEPRTVPWGTVPGRDALFGYLSEGLVHGWDLAVATGQDPEADPRAAEPALARSMGRTPVRTIGGAVIFGPEVASEPHAGPTERLANRLGHHR